jgi:UDP-N-acetylglucosamine--N-acetylmuramyl-(pentapeptide) pyrophosphoryl-undecaprenol N-acetylglucosamine transferase
MEHLLLPVEGLRRGEFWPNLGVAGRLLQSLLATGRAFSALRPSLVVVTGGYAGGPAGVVAGLMGIPLALQEQNSFPGLTTRVLSRWSRQVHLAFPEARSRLPRRARVKARISGNPIREPVGVLPSEARAEFGLAAEGPVVLVVGGSQGSAALNRVVQEAVGDVTGGSLSRLPGLQILWSTGTANFASVEAWYRQVGSPEWVRILPYLDDMPNALGSATLAVSRAGAMTTSEFLASGLPSILVPLPTAAADHQAQNAETLAEAGVAIHLPEEGITGAVLWAALESLLKDDVRMEAMRTAALKRARSSATRDIAGALATLLPPAPGGRA